MMPILVKSDDVRSGRKAKARHVRLRAAQKSMGYLNQIGTFVIPTWLSNTYKMTTAFFVPCIRPEDTAAGSVISMVQLFTVNGRNITRDR